MRKSKEKEKQLQDRNKLVKRLWRMGRSQQEIAKEVKLTQSRVSQIVRGICA